MARITVEQAGSQNMIACLDMIAVCEIGQALLRNPLTDNGYRVMVGSTPRAPIVFESYTTHPYLAEPRPPFRLGSSAAGRYQLLSRYFDVYAHELKLADFSPVSQDLIAIEQIRERGCLALVQQGSIITAMARLATCWASLPNSLFGQPTHPLPFALDAYRQAGGVLS